MTEQKSRDEKARPKKKAKKQRRWNGPQKGIILHTTPRRKESMDAMKEQEDRVHEINRWKKPNGGLCTPTIP